MASHYDLANCLRSLSRDEEATEFRLIMLAWCQKEKAADHSDTLVSLEVLARDLSLTDAARTSTSTRGPAAEGPRAASGDG